MAGFLELPRKVAAISKDEATDVLYGTTVTADILLNAIKLLAVNRRMTPGDIGLSDAEVAVAYYQDGLTSFERGTYATANCQFRRAIQWTFSAMFTTAGVR